MKTHTPGPWRLDDLDMPRTHYVLSNSGYVVAEVPRDRCYIKAARANATLIAAAPDLLAAAQALLDGTPAPASRKGMDLRMRLAHAVDKATGRT